MPKRDDAHTILIIGSAPISIGQGSESDAACVQACAALRGQGYGTVLVKASPVSLVTDPGITAVTYAKPLNTEVLTEITATEQPDALLPCPEEQSGLFRTIIRPADRYDGGIRPLSGPLPPFPCPPHSSGRSPQ